MISRLAWRGLVLVIAALGFAAPVHAGYVPRWQDSGQVSSGYGLTVASAGDVNGDGYYDVIVGAPFGSNGQTNEGRVFIYYGTPSGPTLTPSWTAESNQAGALFGWAVAGLGDVNGDGYDDLAVGAPLFDHTLTDEGAVFVYFGSDTGLSATPVAIYGAKVGALFGAAVEPPSISAPMPASSPRPPGPSRATSPKRSSEAP
jgi:hypothetical protein